jgi:rod shape determining protein RodA
MVAPLAFFFALKPYQQKRITVPLRLLRGETVDYQKEGYAPTNVINAIGSSGWEGKGFGGERMPLDPATGKKKKTMHQLGYIPKDTAHNDYVFAVWAEEQGFRGSLLLISGFALLIFQCVFIAFCARDQVGRLLVVGVAALVFAHVFQNIGMQIQLMPITGIPLPFISYGGTFLVTVMFLMGMVQSVWTHRNVALEEETSREKEMMAERRALA